MLGSEVDAFHFPFRNSKSPRGELGSMTANGNNAGFLIFEYTERNLNLSTTGANSIIGNKIALHALPDDGCSQPDGGIGSGLATGYIGYDLAIPGREPATNWVAAQAAISCPVPSPGPAPAATQIKATKTSFDVALASAVAFSTTGCTITGAKIQNYKDGAWATVQEISTLPGSFQFTCLTAGTSYQLRFVGKYLCPAGSPAGNGAIDSAPSQPQTFQTVPNNGGSITFGVKNCYSWYSCFTYACGSTTDSCDSTTTEYTVAPGSVATFMGTSQDSRYFQGPRFNATVDSQGQLCFDYFYTYGTPQRTDVTLKKECYSAGSAAGAKLASISTAYDKTGDCYECTSVTSNYRSEIYSVRKGDLAEPACTGKSLLGAATADASKLTALMGSMIVAMLVGMIL